MHRPARRTRRYIAKKACHHRSAAAPGPKGDAFVYFVGGRGSGKTTLLNRVLNPSRVGARPRNEPRCPTRRPRQLPPGAALLAPCACQRAWAAPTNPHRRSHAQPSYPHQAEVPAPSGSLDYTYARGGGGGGSSGGSSGGGERSGLAHFWELGGQEGAGLELARSEHTFLTFKQVGGWGRAALCCFVLLFCWVLPGLIIAGRSTCC